MESSHHRPSPADSASLSQCHLLLVLLLLLRSSSFARGICIMILLSCILCHLKPPSTSSLWLSSGGFNLVLKYLVATHKILLDWFSGSCILLHFTFPGLPHSFLGHFTAKANDHPFLNHSFSPSSVFVQVLFPFQMLFRSMSVGWNCTSPSRCESEDSSFLNLAQVPLLHWLAFCPDKSRCFPSNCHQHLAHLILSDQIYLYAGLALPTNLNSFRYFCGCLTSPCHCHSSCHRHSKELCWKKECLN